MEKFDHTIIYLSLGLLGAITLGIVAFIHKEPFVAAMFYLVSLIMVKLMLNCIKPRV